MSRVSAALLLLQASAAIGCAPTTGNSPDVPPNVVFICMDTVRADRLGCYGYERHDTTPALDGLAAESTRFDDSSAAACWTKPSVPSFMTGTYPMQHGVYEGSARGLAGHVTDVLPEAATTLAEVLQQRGYITAAFVQNSQLAVGSGFEQGFDVYEDGAGDARQIRWRAQDWMTERSRERPFFLYLHFLDAHWPYPAPPEFATMFADGADVAAFQGSASRDLRDAINSGERALSDGEKAAMLALYDGSIRYIDAQLGRFFSALEKEGVWANTIVCVLSDHGEEFGEHGKIGHGHGLYENLLRVPWILRVPGVSARVVSTPVSLVDVFPTVLAAAGVRAPATHHGIDRWNQPEVERAILAEHKEKRAYVQSLRSTALKLVRRAEWIPPDSEEGVLSIVDAPRRLEIELGLDGADGWYAKQITVAEGLEGHVELKGVARSVSAAGFSLAGVAVVHDEATEYYGSFAPGEVQVREFDPVKVVGDFESGRLRAVKIKGYVGSGAPPEIRATFDAHHELPDGCGEFEFGPFSVKWDPSTKFRSSELSRQLSREEIVRFAGGGAADDFEVMLEVHELRSPALESYGELPAEDAGGAAASLRASLDSMSLELIERKLFGRGDRKTLTSEDVDSLKAIGYTD